MQATAHRIMLRRKFPPMGVAAVGDFVLRGEDDHLLPAHAILYCLHDTGQRVYFTETTRDVDLTQAAFLHRAQYEQAQRVFSMSYADFHIALDNVSKPRAPIFICGIGRSGTTLVHHALNCLPQVTSWPEPDVFTQLVKIRLTRDAADIKPLLLDCATHFHQQHNTGRVAFKTRSFVTEIIDDIVATFPDAKIIFMYRDAVEWVQSNMRLLTRFPLPDAVLRAILKRVYWDYFPVLHTVDLPSLSLVELVAHIWLAYMQRFQAHCTAGIPMLPVHYDDLKARPQDTLIRIFDFCDLPLDTLKARNGIFNRDAQAGTAFSQMRLRSGYTLSDEEKVLIERITNLTSHIDCEGMVHRAATNEGV